jgi:hypothetical protein
MGLDRALVQLASVVVLGTITSILDTTIVNVAIGTLGATSARRCRRSSGCRRATCWRWRP